MEAFKIQNTPLYLDYYTLINSLEEDLVSKIQEEFKFECKFYQLCVENDTLYFTSYSIYNPTLEPPLKEITKEFKYIDYFRSIQYLKNYVYEIRNNVQ